MNKHKSPAPSKLNLLRQICNFIPSHLVSKLARETGVDDQSRTLSPWSHVLALLYGQLTHCIGLNDLCDSLQLAQRALFPPSVRATTEPKTAFQRQSPAFAPCWPEKLFLGPSKSILGQVCTPPGLPLPGQPPRSCPSAFKMPIHVVRFHRFGTRLPLQWIGPGTAAAKPAAKNAAIVLNLQSLAAPILLLLDTAAEHGTAAVPGSLFAPGVKRGEIVLFDQGVCLDFLNTCSTLQ